MQPILLVQRANMTQKTEWFCARPDKSGVYLFYGDFYEPGSPTYKPRFMLCNAVETSSGELVVFADGMLLQTIVYGKFRVFNEEPPDLSEENED